MVKAKALLMKNMYRELLALNGNIYDGEKIDQVYGYKNEFLSIIQNGLSTSPSKAIYDFLIKEVTHRQVSLIPSRNEKRSPNIKWGLVFKNLKLLKGLDPVETCFAWKITQDMLPVGSRIHRRNAERRCLAVKNDGLLCQETQTLNHVFQSCIMITESYDMIIEVLNRFTERIITYELLVHLGFNHRDKKKLMCGLWFAVKMLYYIFIKKMFNKQQLLQELVKELEWNLDLSRKIGSMCEMMKLKTILTDIQV